METVLKRMVVVLVLAVAAAQLEAAMIKRVAPFEGTFFEGFEQVTNNAALTNLMAGLASCAGVDADLTVQNGNYFNLWDQHAFEGAHFLGGAAGYGTPATIEITFAMPVRKFGGVFGHRVRPGVESAGETEFVFYDARGREIGRDHVFIDSLPGGVGAYWQFTRKVKRVTFTYVHPMADALTASLSPVQLQKFQRATRGASQ
jgi:hypothetical protein